MILFCRGETTPLLLSHCASMHFKTQSAANWLGQKTEDNICGKKKLSEVSAYCQNIVEPIMKTVTWLNYWK